MTRVKALISVAAALACATSAAAAPLTVNIEGIEARGGTFYVGVQTEEQFMQNAGVAGEILSAPAAGSKSFTFDLPEGVYSISVWHDINGNAQFDMSEQGMPMDGWSSINADSLRGPPTFEQTSLALPADGAAATLKVYYPE
jgi:uncharacterized protein (DUF2141 family)